MNFTCLFRPSGIIIKIDFRLVRVTTETGDLLKLKFVLAPIMVLLCEYLAISASVAYAKFAAEFGQPEVGLLGGLINIGGSFPYEAVPGAVVVLHLIALAAIVFFFVNFVSVFSVGENKLPVPPQE